MYGSIALAAQSLAEDPRAGQILQANNPLQTRVSLVFTDFEPNVNKQAVPLSEKENIIRSALNMPLKIMFDGEQYHKHAGAIPIGPIVNVYEDDYNGRRVIKGEAVIWDDEYKEISDHLKSLFDKGVSTSWEIYYSESSVDESGVEWLHDCIVANTCIVNTPAYGSERTRILAIAEQIEQDNNKAISESVSTPGWMRSNARRGLKWHEEGKSGDGVTAQTVREARQMAEGSVSLDKAKRMAAWFARHMVDLNAPAAKPGNDKFPSPGVVAHALWGGGSRTSSMRAMRWAERVSARDTKEQSTVHMNETILTSESTSDLNTDLTSEPIITEATTQLDNEATSNMNGDEGYEDDSMQSEFKEALQMLMAIYDRLTMMEQEAVELEEARKKKKNYDIDGMAEAFNEVIAKLGTKMKDLRASAESLQRSNESLTLSLAEITDAHSKLAAAEAARIEKEQKERAKAELLSTRRSKLAESAIIFSDDAWKEREDIILEMSDRVFAHYIETAKQNKKSTASAHVTIPEPIHISEGVDVATLARAISKTLKK